MRCWRPSVATAARKRLFFDSGGNPFFLQALRAWAPRRPAGERRPAPRACRAAVVAALAGEISALEPSARLLGSGRGGGRRPV